MFFLKMIVFIIAFMLSISLGHFIYEEFKKRKYILIGMLLITICPTIFFDNIPKLIQYLITLNGVSMVVAGFEVSRIKMSKSKINF